MKKTNLYRVNEIDFADGTEAIYVTYDSGRTRTYDARTLPSTIRKAINAIPTGLITLEDNKSYAVWNYDFDTWNNRD